VSKDECKAVEWLRKAAKQGEADAQEALEEWDAALVDFTIALQVIYDPDPRATVCKDDVSSGWKHGTDEEDDESFTPAARGDESQKDDGLVQRMSPWAVRFELNWDMLDDDYITMREVRGKVEAVCRRAGWAASVASSDGVVDPNPEADDHGQVLTKVLRVRLLEPARADPPSSSSSSEATRPFLPCTDTAGVTRKREAGATTCDGGGSSARGEQQQARELTVCCPDGTSHKLTVSQSTTILEVKLHVRRAARGGTTAGFASAEEESSTQPFWQDEHAVQRQHIFVHGAEDELTDAQSMGSLGSPAALFLMVDTEASFMERLQAEAAALRGRLEGVKLRDLAECGVANAATAAALLRRVAAHEHALVNRGLRQGWFCDGLSCTSGGDACHLQDCFRCPEGCDFDLCEACVAADDSEPEGASAVEAGAAGAGAKGTGAFAASGGRGAASGDGDSSGPPCKRSRQAD
jgi:hypothetical protein